MTRDEIIAKIDDAIYEAGFEPGQHIRPRAVRVETKLSDLLRERRQAEAVFDALCSAIPGLSDVIDGKAVIVPVEATGAMRYCCDHINRPITTAEIWRAMLSASPYARKDEDAPVDPVTPV